MKLTAIKTIAACLFIGGCSSSAENTQYQYKVLRVIDGDTVVIDAPFLPKELGNTLRLRVHGIDTPEKAPRARCVEESTKAQQAKQLTTKLINESNSIRVQLKKWDKYGGRVLGDIYVNGKLLSSILIDNKLAVAYDGGTKSSWCKRG